MTTFDRAVMFCRAWDLDDYDPERRRIYDLGIEATLAEGNLSPSIYPGSIIERCERCDIRVGVGPRQQAALEKMGRASIEILCMMCAIEIMGEEARTKEVEVHVANLGNPFMKAPPKS